MTRYIITEDGEENLHRDFTELYNTDYWRFKLYTLEAIIDDTELFADSFEDALPEWEIDSYRRTLISEVVMTFFHSAEALFALTVNKDHPLPWLALQNYDTKETYDIARDFEDESFDEEEIQSMFYLNPRNLQEEILQSAVFIKDYLKRMAPYYLDNDIYNSYKHGLRLVSTEEHYEIDAEEIDEPITFGGSTLVSLESEELDEFDIVDPGEDEHEYRKLVRYSHGYDHEFYSQLGIINADLIDQLLNVIRFNLAGVDEMEITAKDFSDVSIDNVFDFDDNREYTFRRSYELGERAIQIEE